MRYLLAILLMICCVHLNAEDEGLLTPEIFTSVELFPEIEVYSAADYTENYPVLYPVFSNAIFFNIGIRMGVYYPRAEIFHEIYEKNGYFWGVEFASRALIRRVRAIAGMDFYSARGKSIGEGRRTKIDLFPIYAGIRHPIFSINSFESYFDLGPIFEYMKIFDQATCSLPIETSNWGVGGFGRLGIAYSPLVAPIRVAAFWELAYIKIPVHQDDPNITRYSADLSGYKVGLSFSYLF